MSVQLLQVVNRPIDQKECQRRRGERNGRRGRRGGVLVAVHCVRGTPEETPISFHLPPSSSLPSAYCIDQTHSVVRLKEERDKSLVLHAGAGAAREEGWVMGRP